MVTETYLSFVETRGNHTKAQGTATANSHHAYASSVAMLSSLTAVHVSSPEQRDKQRIVKYLFYRTLRLRGSVATINRHSACESVQDAFKKHVSL